MFTDEELEMLQWRIDDPDWDISQRNDVWELLPRLLEVAKAAQQGVQADVCLACANYQSCPGFNLVPDEWSCALRTRR